VPTGIIVEYVKMVQHINCMLTQLRCHLTERDVCRTNQITTAMFTGLVEEMGQIKALQVEEKQGIP